MLGLQRVLGGRDLSKQMRCLSCGHRWDSPHARARCVACGHIYVEWTNFEQWRKANRADKGGARC